MNKDGNAGDNLTGVRKRQQIQQANRAMLTWVAVASAVATVCIVLGINFIQRIVYNGKIINEISQTKSTLDKNLATVNSLKANVNKLEANQNLIALENSGDTAFQVVIDALPTEDNRTGLASSIQEKILVSSGVQVEQVSVTDSGVAVETTDSTTQSSVKPTPQTITFGFVINGDYDSIRGALAAIEKTIRPIKIDVMSVTGTSDALQATFTATTYYMPSVLYKLGEKEVQP
jgi:cell division protein FtsB